MSESMPVEPNWRFRGKIRVFPVGLLKVRENLIKLAFGDVVMGRVGAVLVRKNQILGF